MLGVWLWMLILLIITGCGSQQQSLEKGTPGKKEGASQEEKTSIYPAWFEEEERGSSDTLHFYGYGMAVANDSTESLELALGKAHTNLYRTVDDSLEQLRVRLINQKDSSFNQLKNPAFILSLRNALSFVDTRASVGERVVKKHENRWVSFVQTHIPFKTVKQKLKSPLSEYPDFYQALE
jgi:hypothetical protein